jgi:predicted ATPase
VSHWLGDPERLNAGYNVHCKRFKELDLSDPWVVQLLTGSAIDDTDSIRLSLEKLPTRSRIQILPSTAHGRVSQNAGELQSQDVGVGISQVLPVIVTALDGKGRLLAIEQPELHLHPRFQAELADLFIQAAKGETAHTLILETHSEHLILRLQRRIREQAKGPATNLPPITGDDVAIYHVTQQAGQTMASRIELDCNGDFIQPWPDDFFEIDFYERFGHAD